MGYLTVDNHGEVTTSTEMGTNILNSIFGGGDHIKRYEEQGDSLAKIYFSWKNTLDRYTAEAKRIPTGSGQKRLRDEYTKLYAMADRLDPSFEPGATQGTETRAMVNDFVAGIKAFGKDKQALMNQYGLKPIPDGTKVGSQNPRKAGAAGGIPLLAIGLAALALAKFFKKK